MADISRISDGTETMAIRDDQARRELADLAQTIEDIQLMTAVDIDELFYDD